jgi:hypothetical protein
MAINSRRLAEWMDWLRSMNDELGMPYSVPLEIQTPAAGVNVVQYARWTVPSDQHFFVFRLTGSFEIIPSANLAFHADPMVQRSAQVQVQVRANPPGTELFSGLTRLAHFAPNVCQKLDPLEFAVPWRIQQDAVIEGEFWSNIPEFMFCQINLNGILVDSRLLKEAMETEGL